MEKEKLPAIIRELERKYWLGPESTFRSRSPLGYFLRQQGFGEKVTQRIGDVLMTEQRQIELGKAQYDWHLTIEPLWKKFHRTIMQKTIVLGGIEVLLLVLLFPVLSGFLFGSLTALFLFSLVKIRSWLIRATRI